jgi:hypothetical protein
MTNNKQIVLDMLTRQHDNAIDNVEDVEDDAFRAECQADVDAFARVIKLVEDETYDDSDEAFYRAQE